MVSVNTLLNNLPVFKGDKELIAGRQRMKHIKALMQEAHQEYAPDYDGIVGFFKQGPGLPKQLFDFVQKNIRYEVQDEDFQSVESPAAILAQGEGDCKHYASFIAGILDAANREGRYRYPWVFRFGTWKGKNMGHVFVVVKDAQGGEIWIDPAPIDNILGGQTARYFNDRLSIPDKYVDVKPKDMGLYKVSGPGAILPIVTETVVRRADKPQAADGCCCVGLMAVQESDYGYQVEPYTGEKLYNGGGGGGGYDLISFDYSQPGIVLMPSDEPYYTQPASIPPVVKDEQPIPYPTQETPANGSTSTPPPIQTAIPNTAEVPTATADQDTPAATKKTGLAYIFELAAANPIPTAFVVGTVLFIATRKKKKRRS